MAIVPTLAINAFNSGAMALTNVIGVATAKLDGSAGPGVAITAALASLAIGAIAPLTFDAPPPYSGPACGPRHTA
ncbi:MAG: hypothetical protein ABIR10_15630 [Dokdonella sp.]